MAVDSHVWYSMRDGRTSFSLSPQIGTASPAAVIRVACRCSSQVSAIAVYLHEVSLQVQPAYDFIMRPRARTWAATSQSNLLDMSLSTHLTAYTMGMN